ncbi:hypothetical protein T265_08632 [Opisthorchis viverrini]|uniref:Uncharacterized protein n=1 Tax=Opisthorchis viverrini TaxID=6198 RepID=A0A074ZJC8_OPIVI|nr:hypothetical protein T265_08632 [Opisthorchis viverrini]KER23465.1 hypothetical protein T265_08632 [Opisthorchis viverrini]
MHAVGVATPSSNLTMVNLTPSKATGLHWWVANQSDRLFSDKREMSTTRYTQIYTEAQDDWFKGIVTR